MNEQPTYPSDNNPEARAAEFRTSVFHQFRAGAERMTQLEHAVEVNTRTTNENSAEIKAMRADTAEMVEIFMAMKGGFKVLEWLGRLAKWAAAIAAGVGLIVKLTGYTPPWK